MAARARPGFLHGQWFEDPPRHVLSRTVGINDEGYKGLDIYSLYRHLHLMSSSCLQFEVAYWYVDLS